MFEKKTKRYLTRGVNEQVPVLIQGLCWKLIDRQVTQQAIKLDYLQIFEFQRDINRNVIIIIHRQEEPYFKERFEVRISPQVESFQIDKLWVIDDDTHQIMLLPEEY